MNRLSMVAMLVGCLLASHIASTKADDPVATIRSFDSTVRPFLKRYCFECHGTQKQKADRRFDRLSAVIGDDDSLVDYQDILDLLNLGEMPPEEAKQPQVDERKKVIASLTEAIGRYHQSSDLRGHAVLRRLNSREYRNTIRDLLHIDVSVFDPTEKFPRDQIDEHLDNMGQSLVTSGHLLARYLESAEVVIDKALSPIERPEKQTWVFRDGFNQQPEIDQVHRKTNRFSHMTLYDVVGADKPEGAYGPIHAFEEGVPLDGVYELRIRAEAVNRIHPYDREFVGTNPDEPLRLGIVPGDHLVGNLHLPQPNEPLLAEIDLADEPRWYTVRLWLDRGITPRFTFRNGLIDARNIWSKLIKRYPEQFPKGISKGIVSARFNAIKHGKLPQIHIHEIEIEGPIFETWPTESHLDVFGDHWPSLADSNELPGDWKVHLKQFMKRAYRRPVKDDEVARIVSLVESRLSSGRSKIESYGDGLKAVLCSPSFLYLEQGQSTQLSAHGLASRLSYFLWASMPDDELFALAESGELLDDAVLSAQVDRMLSDSKSTGFVDGFLASWLTLRDLGSTPPDRGDFRAFYHYDLDSAMRQETRLFFRHVLDEDLDVVHFLDADFTYVNQALADLYDLDVKVNGFQKVALTDRRRGGLLGQASVLTVTANGIDTSPVVRGVWLLENILGTPPSPPPPDVEPLDPDVRGAKTIRDQLAKHRNVPSCNECHRKIDPIGFALENFDPIGRWREQYGRDSKIDASGEMPGGKTFQNVVGFKKILVNQKNLFRKALAEKLASYATGRPMHPSDRPVIDEILRKSEKSGDGFKNLVKLVVLSDTFRTK